MKSITFLRKNEFRSEHSFEAFPSINDLDYLSFMKDNGDGFYFTNSLHFYGTSLHHDFHDLVYRNKILRQYYWEFIDTEVVCFAEDLFANQFVFYNKGIGILYIETGKIDFLAQNFTKWLSEIENDLDYFSGESLMIEWVRKNKISLDERLTPKIPFILGGAYQSENLYKAKFNAVLEFNSDLAIQIRDLPDGSSINLKIVD